jgi:hypothetical protein
LKGKKLLAKLNGKNADWGLKLGHRFQYSLAKLGLSAVKFMSETIKRTNNQKHVFICIKKVIIFGAGIPLSISSSGLLGHAFHQLLEVTAVQGSSFCQGWCRQDFVSHGPESCVVSSQAC